MNIRQLFDPRGANLWLILAGFGWNVVWMFVTLLAAYLVLDYHDNAATVVQLRVMVSAFVGSFLGGWITGRVAGDGRGATYGVFGSLGSILLIACTLMAVGGILGLMVAVAAWIGRLNGGLLSQERRRHS